MDCGTTKPTLKFVSSHTPKRRSSAACLECRRRKVRCDILAIKAKTCTNCRLDGIQCEMVESRRRRYVETSVRHTIACSSRDIQERPGEKPIRYSSVISNSWIGSIAMQCHLDYVTSGKKSLDRIKPKRQCDFGDSCGTQSRHGHDLVPTHRRTNSRRRRWNI